MAYTGLDLSDRITPEKVVRAKARHPQSERSVAALELLRQRERDGARRNRRLFLSGCGLLLIVPTVGLGALFAVAHRAHPGAEQNARFAVYLGVRFVQLVVLALYAAVAVRRESRADAARQYMDSGSYSAGSGEKAIVRWFGVLLLVGMTYGGYMCVDAVKTAWLRLRLRRVDRYRAASVLALLQSTPAGVDPRRLLLHGENPLTFRRTLAYLVIHDWADISPRGDHLVALSPARRNLRQGWSV